MNRIRLLVLILTAALTLAAVVPWGDFTGHTHWDEVGWIPFVSWAVRRWDITLNVLLFTPLGIVCAVIFRSGVLAAGTTAFGVSLFGEWLQVYSHSRFPSATDLVCNVGGAVMAAVIVRWSGQRLARRHPTNLDRLSLPD